MGQSNSEDEFIGCTHRHHHRINLAISEERHETSFFSHAGFNVVVASPIRRSDLFTWKKPMTDRPSITIIQKEDYQFLVDFGEAVPVLLADEPVPLGKGEGPSPTHLLL